MPPRIEHWGLRLQEYTYTITHKPRKAENLADYMSRHPQASARTRTSVADEDLRFATNRARPPAISSEDIAVATANDITIQEVTRRPQTDRWRYLGDADTRQGTNLELSSFRHFKDELSVAEDGLISRDKRIVIPEALRQ